MTTILWCLVAALVVTLFALFLAVGRAIGQRKNYLETHERMLDFHGRLLEKHTDHMEYVTKMQSVLHRIAEEVAYLDVPKADKARVLALIPLSKQGE